MTFGPDGQLWVGDVGWEMYEMVFNVKRGGNYGWSIMEGPQPVLPNQPRAPSRILPAATAYSHAEGASVTGGYVYRGSKFDELSGKYVFGDFETRRIWSAAITPVDGESDALTELTDLIEPSVRIVAFAEDSENELLLLDFDRGTIHGLEANPLSDQPSDFPTTLSDTGLFQDTASQTVAAGVVPFEVTAPMWNDGAQAERWVAVPGTGSIEVLPGPRQLRESSLRERMHFPTDSVLARTITLNDDNDKPVRLETQLLHFNGKIWNGYTYVWNPEQTDAKLAATEGTAITLADYGQFADRSTWKVHSRSECNRCHNLWVGGTLAFTVPQLNRFTDHDGAGSATSARSDTGQLNRMQAMGLLTGRVPAAPASGDRSALTDPYDATANLSHRARSYLAVNCAHCHQNGAGGTSTIDLRPDITLDEMKSLNASPAQGLFQMANASVISPGDPLRSVLYYRTACSGRGRMPHIGSEEVDVAAVAMLGEWIRSLGEQPTEQLASAVDVPRSTRDALRLVAMFDHDQLDAETQTRILKHVREAAPEISNLFTRFQPLEYRRSLSQPLNAAKILATQGDPQHGARLFADNRLQCANCHRIGDVGGRIGPALNDVGKRLKADEILEAVLEPSKKIDPKFAAWTIITESGRVHSGLLIDRTESEIILRTAANEDVRISRQQIEEQFQQVTSLMPDRLLSGLSEQDVADLIAFLSQQQTPRLLTIPNNSHHLPSRNTVSCFE
jgi:putative heme-binding domain-containing protein